MGSGLSPPPSRRLARGDGTSTCGRGGRSEVIRRTIRRIIRGHQEDKQRSSEGLEWAGRRGGRAVAGAHMSSSHTGKALSHVEQVRKWVSPHSRQYASRLPPFARRTVATHRCTSHCRLGTCSAITLPRKSSSGGARGHCSQLRWAGVKIRLQKAHLMKEAISDPQRKGVKIRLQKAHLREKCTQMARRWHSEGT